MERDALVRDTAALLRSLGLKLATAESATGGRLSDSIISLSGSSEYFLGGVIAYDNEVKVRLLGVSRDDLRLHGAVSREVAEAMARGAREALGADIGVSTTGIAGPTGATPQKPVGLVFTAVSSRRGTRCQRLIFQGDREQNKESFATAALRLLKEELERWQSERS